MKKITTVILIFASTFFNLGNQCFAQFTKLHDFGNGLDGTNPTSSLISDGTFLYGTTTIGGTNSSGTIFKMKPDGTSYSQLFAFPSNGINGGNPHCDLILEGAFLYGTTVNGGINGFGIIFKIKPDGTGYAKIFDFNGINGSSPCSLISDGTFLYGMTSGNGLHNNGTIFKIMPDGSGYFKILDFAGSSNGAGPSGSLYFDGTFLYGMTADGGTGTGNYCSGSGCGVLFKIKPDGTGYSKLIDFNGTNGRDPYGSIIYDGTFLYGMTSGGSIGSGTIFKIKPDSTGYVKLLDFDFTANGGSPQGSLISMGSFLYGMTSYGGTNNDGAIFKIKFDGTGYAKLLDFSGTTNGKTPFGSLFSDGTALYGMTNIGGINNVGVVFKYALTTNEIAENNKANNFNIYPNPSNGTFTVDTKKNDYKLIITNILGEIVYQSEIKNPQSEIDLSKQPKGVYFVQMTYEDKNTFTKKIVLQ